MTRDPQRRVAVVLESMCGRLGLLAREDDEVHGAWNIGAGGRARNAPPGSALEESRAMPHAGDGEPHSPRPPQRVREARGYRAGGGFPRELEDEREHGEGRERERSDPERPGGTLPERVASRDPPGGDSDHARDLGGDDRTLEDVRNEPRSSHGETGGPERRPQA